MKDTANSSLTLPENVLNPTALPGSAPLCHELENDLQQATSVTVSDQQSDFGPCAHCLPWGLTGPGAVLRPFHRFTLSTSDRYERV